MLDFLKDNFDKLNYDDENVIKYKRCKLHINIFKNLLNNYGNKFDTLIQHIFDEQYNVNIVEITKKM